MPIRDFQLYHGALLTALVRSNRTITLRVVETSANDCWSAYVIDDVVTYYTKYSAHGTYDAASKAMEWKFTFQEDHLKDLGRLEKSHRVFIAFVCANHDLRVPTVSVFPDDDASGESYLRGLNEADRQWKAWVKQEKVLRRNFTGICVLEPGEWHQCLELTSDQVQSVAVQLTGGRSFLVNGRLHVPRNRLVT